MALDLLSEPAARDLVPIPELGDSSVGQDAAIDVRSRIPGIIREPNRVDADLGGWILRQNFLLHPPGALKADTSGRRKDQDEARGSGILVEIGSQLLDVAQLRHVSRSLAPQLVRNGRSEAEDGDQHDRR